jgi:hypothetical protein
MRDRRVGISGWTRTLFSESDRAGSGKMSIGHIIVYMAHIGHEQVSLNCTSPWFHFGPNARLNGNHAGPRFRAQPKAAASPQSRFSPINTPSRQPQSLSAPPFAAREEYDDIEEEEMGGKGSRSSGGGRGKRSRVDSFIDDAASEDEDGDDEYDGGRGRKSKAEEGFHPDRRHGCGRQ